MDLTSTIIVFGFDKPSQYYLRNSSSITYSKSILKSILSNDDKNISSSGILLFGSILKVIRKIMFSGECFRDLGRSVLSEYETPCTKLQQANILLHQLVKCLLPILSTTAVEDSLYSNVLHNMKNYILNIEKY